MIVRFSRCHIPYAGYDVNFFRGKLLMVEKLYVITTSRKEQVGFLSKKWLRFYCVSENFHAFEKEISLSFGI